MSEDLTRDLPEQTFQERVLAELSAIRHDIGGLDRRLATVENRLTTLEDKVERRLQETRPIWEGIHDQLRKLDGKFGIILKEFYEVRYDIMALGRRVEQLEETSSR